MQESGAARPGKRGRPSKSNLQHAADETEPAFKRKDRAGKKPESIGREKFEAAKRKGKAVKSPADEDSLGAEPGRDGRERRAGRHDVVLGKGRPDRSSRRTAASYSDTNTLSTKQTESASDPPSSTPRRSTRERRARDPVRAFGSRLGDRNEAAPIQAAGPARPKKRGKAPQEGAIASKVREQVSASDDAVDQKRHGRVSLERDESPGEGSIRQRRSKQKNLEEIQASSVEQAEGAAQPKRRGRPRAVDVVQERDPELRQSSSSRARRGRLPEVHKDQEPASAKRKAPDARPPAAPAEEASSESGDSQQLPFRHLQETIRDIPRSMVAKWNFLDPPAINAVSAVLADAQRPVLLRLQDTNRRREHASAALGQISRRVRTKLAKGLPFPPPTGGISTRANTGSYEDDFNFERTVDAVQAMENTLNPLLHSVGLLEKEIEREEDALAREYDALHKLETNAKAKAKEWKHRERREHVLAPGVKSKGDGDGQESRGRLEFVPATDDEVAGGLFKVSQFALVNVMHLIS